MALKEESHPETWVLPGYDLKPERRCVMTLKEYIDTHTFDDKFFDPHC